MSVVGTRSLFPAAVASGLILAAVALSAPLNHDESQYVAAAVLSRDHLIFRDFMSLQPPLHAWVFAPVAALFLDDALLAMRLGNAVLALGLLVCVYRAQRALDVRPAVALTACALLLACRALLFCAGVARNDMLPAALLGAALLAMIGGSGRRHAFAAGLAIGLAVSSKLSFAPFGPAAFLALLLRGPSRRADALAYAVGATLGLVPMLTIAALQPDAFLWGNLVYGTRAPVEWYALNGATRDLTAAGKAQDLLRFLAEGPAILALGVVLWRRRTIPPRAQAILLPMLAAGAIGAWLPTPAHRQYLLPLLPPLFIALGVVLQAAPSASPMRRPFAALAAILALVGIVAPIKRLGSGLRQGFPVMTAEATADEVAAVLRRESYDGPVASLSPERIVGPGLTLDPRSAAGPFVFRTRRLLDAAAAARFHVLVPATLSASPATAPAAVLTGYEHDELSFKVRAEAPLLAFLQRSHYRPIPLADGQGVLWLKPAAPSTLRSKRA